ncbi:OmpH family outer membrane protein [Psychroflexus sp. CAK57W]|uniref:OmpH family outer membrane protein n=1 Tax=Psychroflexus curvus TaxID=2873595 RepID=UPI001CCEC56F|nr:OmpH family outer membrane protein [Psychroflexus curvus]MBZ9628036.1 OmpH family outer membrane protein [Psychroflexus curvus]MBZ9787735.1 OmpH family outer membrane protein [Psychroflexus curvus]
MKHIICIALLALSLTSFSQTKVGTVNNEYILTQMPEIKGVEEKLKVYSVELDSTIQAKYEAYRVVVEDYNKKEEEGMNDVMKKIKQKEIIDLEEDLKKLQQNSSKMLQIQQEEYLRPLYNKIGTALEAIVKEEGYTQVFDENNSIIYIDPRFDLTLKVLKRLGIEIKENAEVIPEENPGN